MIQNVAEEVIVEFRTLHSVQHRNFGGYCFIIPVLCGNINFSKNSYKSKPLFANIPLLLIPMNE